MKGIRCEGKDARDKMRGEDERDKMRDERDKILVTSISHLAPCP